MKKIISLFVVLMLAFSFSACSKKEASTTTAAKTEKSTTSTATTEQTTQAPEDTIAQKMKGVYNFHYASPGDSFTSIEILDENRLKITEYGETQNYENTYSYKADTQTLSFTNNYGNEFTIQDIGCSAGLECTIYSPEYNQKSIAFLVDEDKAEQRSDLISELLDSDWSSPYLSSKGYDNIRFTLNTDTDYNDESSQYVDVNISGSSGAFKLQTATNSYVPAELYNYESDYQSVVHFVFLEKLSDTTLQAYVYSSNEQSSEVYRTIETWTVK